MDLHPVLVHFPIALLTVYAVLELARFPRLLRTTWWRPVKAILVIIGAGMAALTYLTGSLLEEAMEASGSLPQVVEIHGLFAGLTLATFSLLALAYLIDWSYPSLPRYLAAESVPVRVAQKILLPAVALPLALLGLAFVTITGALGGAMVYGADVDPFVSVIYHLLVK